MIDLEALAERARAGEPRCADVRVVAIDGGAGAGKSTLAESLAATLGAPILACDDLLDGWDDQFTFWRRLRMILHALARGEVARYRRYDWVLGAFTDEISLAPQDFLIVEGVSAIDACGAAASLRIWLDVPRRVRERRWIRRDGPGLAPERQRWLDAEDEYFARHPIQADVIVRP